MLSQYLMPEMCVLYREVPLYNKAPELPRSYMTEPPPLHAT